MKNDIREKYKLVHKNILDKEKKDSRIYQRLINDQMVLSADTILIYVSNKEEVDTIEFIKYFLHSKKIAVPKIEGNEINFYYINTFEDLLPGKFHTLEPRTNNMVKDFSNAVCITPGICFDLNKNRIGYGSGYYDRFFAKHNVYKIGLCYSDCFLASIPCEDHDVKVDQIIID